MMEPQTLINYVLGIVSAAIGWFARELWTAVKDLKSDLAKLREELPKTYVTRDDFREDMRELKDMLAKIFDKLDGKADK
jgi:cell division protein FtsB